MTKLPADLLTESVLLVGSGKTSCLGGIRRGTQGVCAHMGNSRGLPRGSGGCRCCGSVHVTSDAPTNKSAADLHGRIQQCQAALLSLARKHPHRRGQSPRLRGIRAGCRRSLSLLERSRSSRALRRPRTPLAPPSGSDAPTVAPAIGRSPPLQSPTRRGQNREGNRGASDGQAASSAAAAGGSPGLSST